MSFKSIRVLYPLLQKGFLLFLILLLNGGLLSKVSAQDIIPPVIISPPRDTSFECGVTQDLIGKLTAWYNDAAGAVATDDSDSITWKADITLQQAITIFNNSLDVICGNKQRVEVSFTAQDTSGNQSQTLKASFFTTDTKGPRLLNTVPIVQYDCIEGIRDTLIKWIRNRAGYNATDDCSNSITWKNFNYAISQNNIVIQSGGGSILNGPYPVIPDGICSWRMNISFIVADECGNETGTPGTTSFSVTDNIAPVFNALPEDVTVDCDKIPVVPNITATDYCDRMVVPVYSFSSTQLSDSTLCGYYNYTITRNWTVSDKCGNSSSYTQLITVRDTTPPLLISPQPEITLSCQTFDANTDSLFISFKDQCAAVRTSFVDTLRSSGCNSLIERTYTLADICSNITSFKQMLIVIRDVDPMITTAAQNQEYDCQSLENFNALLSIWVLNRGNSTAESACSELKSFAAIKGSYDINNSSTFPGINPVNLPPQTCPSALDGFLRYLEVDFVYYDTCGNTSVTSAVFGIKDENAPAITSCPPAIIQAADENSCYSQTRIKIPVATDDCVESTSPVTKVVSVPVTSSTPAGPESIVDSKTIKIGPFNSSTSTPTNDGMLLIKLRNLDIDDVTEFFNIFDEDGANIGKTPVGAGQCASSEFTISLDKNKINSWIQDGFIDVTFAPNIIEGSPVLSINNICSGSAIETTISFDIDIKNTIKKSYAIDNGPMVTLNNEEEIDLELSKGDHLIHFSFTDCANNVAICTVPVTIEDKTAPEITCPSNKFTVLSTGQCKDTVTLDIDFAVIENCEGSKKYESLSPTSDEASYLSFVYNESKGMHEARSKQIVFTNVFPVTHTNLPVSLEIYFLGDNNESGEYYEIFGPDGFLIGSTQIVNGSGNCTLSRTIFEIDRTKFNAWIDDQQVSILAVPKNGNDGINPCADIPSGGTVDNLSYLKGRLFYSDMTFSISTSGATVITEKEIPAGNSKLDLILNAGKNIVTLRTKDNAGNVGTCQFDIEVQDMELPVAKCQNAVATLHPSGLETLEITSQMINNGSSDNCIIEKMSVIPSTLDCSFANSDVSVQFVVEDKAGNTNSCISIIRVKAAEITPSFSAGLCSTDTLKLFANVPPASIEGTYSFHWDGPGNIEFFTENPFIPNADESFNGLYVLTVTGFNNCTSVGSVLVNIKPLINPALTANSKDLCETQDLILTTSDYSGDIEYQWYEGIFPTGILLKTTQIPEFILNPNVGIHFYYVIAKGPDCSSNPSSLLKVTVLKTPDAIVNNSFLSPCEGDEIVLGTPVNNINFTYHWSGPSGYNEVGRLPKVISNASLVNGGDYFLTIRNGMCFSDTAVTKVVILERPLKPTIIGADIFCEGVIFTLVATSSPNVEKFEWYKNGILFTTTQENSLIIPNAQSALQGTWTVISVKGNCKSGVSNAKFVAIDNSLEIGVTNSGPVCMGDSVRLEATFVPNATYKWAGPPPNIPNVYDPLIPGVPGDYSVTITTPTGCQNNANTTVTVISVPEITALSNNSKPCMNPTDVIQFFPSVFPPDDNNYTYSWTGPAGFLSQLKSPMLSNLSMKDTGTYTLVIFNNGCPSEKIETKVSFNLIPEKPAVSGPAFVCTGNPITLQGMSANSDVEYIWKTPLGNLSTAVNTIQINEAIPANSGTYSLQVKANGCLSPVSDSIFIEIRNTPSVPVIMAKSPVCFGDTIRLSTDIISGAQYLWQGPGNPGNVPEIVISNATLSNSGFYSVRIANNGCTSKISSPVEIVVKNEIKTPTFSLPSVSICKTNPSGAEICFLPTSLEANAIFSIFNTSNQKILSEGNSSCFFITDLSGLSDGANFLIARATLGECVSKNSDPFIFNINTPPSVIATAVESDIVTCPGEVVRLISAFGPPLVEVKWTALNPENMISEINAVAPTISGLLPGENIIYLDYSIDGCKDFTRDTVNIYVEFKPEVNDDVYRLSYGETGVLNVFQNDVLPDDVIFTLISAPESGKAIIDGNTIKYTPDSRFLKPVQFSYRVCAGFCDDQCDEGKVIIEFDDEILCKAPNIFTPNGDGINDNFVIPCLDSDRFPANKVMIFNEWGDEVYFASPYKNDWSGTFGGNELPAGTYFYIMDTGDGQRPVNGFLILQR